MAEHHKSIGLAALAMSAASLGVTPFVQPGPRTNAPDRPRPKHLPHQGEREIARRLRQQARKDAR